MRIVLVGPGRAGTALSLAALRAGHETAAVAARDTARAARVAALLDAPVQSVTDPLPACDLIVVATTDDAIATVAARLHPDEGTGAAVHLSGAVPVDVLQPLADRSLAVGSFHPLQTLPTPQAGAERLAGSWIAITAADAGLSSQLRELAESLGAVPFDLDDDVKPLYHAAAAAAANFPLVALAMAQDLFARAGVPGRAAEPLVEAVVANAFSLGARRALTGPIARGDVETVRRQLAAVDGAAPEWADTFRAFVAETAMISGRGDEFAEVIE